MLHILRKHKIGPNLLNYIEKVWENQKFTLRQAQFYSKEISADRGVTQGDIDSPVLFNIIVDSVLRAWRKIIKSHADKFRSLSSFYADDGLLENNNPVDLQHDLNIVNDLFAKVGLKANAKKTKHMIVRGAAAPKALSKDAYDNIDRRRKNQQTTASYAEQRKQIVSCPICNKQISATSLQRHLTTQHKQTITSKYER